MVQQQERKLSDYTSPEELVEAIFEPVLVEEFKYKGNIPGKSLVGEVRRHINDQRKLPISQRGDAATDRELLRHLGVRLPPHKWAKLFRCRRQHDTHPVLESIQSLAKKYAANGGSLPGMSFEQHVESLLKHHFRKNPDDQAPDLLGGAAPRCTNGPTIESLNDVPYTENGTASYILHLLRGRDVVTKGTGPISSRVSKKFIADIEKELDGTSIPLYHGTIARYATDIIRSGPNPDKGSDATDYGRAFYLTNSLPFALEHAHNVSDGKSVQDRSHDPTILVFLVPKSTFSSSQTLNLNGRADDWKIVVQASRRGEEGLKNLGSTQVQSLLETLDNSKCVMGPISANGGQIDKGQVPRPIEDQNLSQYAIKGRRRQEPMASLFAALRSGTVHVLRVMNEEENEWSEQQPRFGAPPLRRGRRAKKHSRPGKH
jgi:hypothetical protein